MHEPNPMHVHNGCCIQRLLDTLANRQSPHAPRRVRTGIGYAMATEHWVWANEVSIFFYLEISALLTYGNGRVAHTKISIRNDL